MKTKKRQKRHDGAYLIAEARQPVRTSWDEPKRIVPSSIKGNTNTGEKYITFGTRHGRLKYRLVVNRWGVDLEFDSMDDALLVREHLLRRYGRVVYRYL